MGQSSIVEIAIKFSTQLAVGCWDISSALS